MNPGPTQRRRVDDTVLVSATPCHLRTLVPCSTLQQGLPQQRWDSSSILGHGSPPPTSRRPRKRDKRHSCVVFKFVWLDGSLSSGAPLRAPYGGRRSGMGGRCLPVVVHGEEEHRRRTYRPTCTRCHVVLKFDVAFFLHDVIVSVADPRRWHWLLRGCPPGRCGGHRRWGWSCLCPLSMSTFLAGALSLCTYGRRR